MQRDGLPRAIGGHQQFTCSTSASPETVWSALTDPEQTKAFLYGLAAHSCWQVDAAIDFRHEQYAAAGPGDARRPAVPAVVRPGRRSR